MLDIATRGDIEAAETRVREELVTRGRGEREHVTSAASVLRRAIDGIATDVKKADRHAELASEIDRLHGKTDALVPRLGRVDDVVQIMNVSTADAFERSEKRVTEIHAGLTELLDELKKRKKGWFS
jgi:hypothetical protein